MTKHVIGQSIYQLILLLIILFSGPNFIVETDSKFIEYGFGFKYCFNSSGKIDPILNISSIQNPQTFVNTYNPNVYLISGSIADYGNSTNVTFPNFTYCNSTFGGNYNLKDAYTYKFKAVNIIFKIGCCSNNSLYNNLQFIRYDAII